jgi:hypothetical protein
MVYGTRVNDARAKLDTYINCMMFKNYHILASLAICIPTLPLTRERFHSLDF